MRAAVLDQFGAPLAVREIPDPIAGSGQVVVDVVAAPVLPYAGEVHRGERRHLLSPPAVPGTGAIGRIRALGPDATRLAVGDWVLCDPTLRSRDDARSPDIALQGLTARGPGGLRLQQHLGRGSFAQQLLTPTENVEPLGDLDPADAGRWAALTVCLVPFGGLLAGQLSAGETVLVNGATGPFGSAGIAVALAMGAGQVVAAGRDTAALAELTDRFGPRLRAAQLTGDEDTDRDLLTRAAPIDLVLDLLPPTAPAGAVRAAAMSVREGGRVVLMGGVDADLALPYRWLMRQNVTVRGQWMFPRAALPRIVALARSGLLDLTGFAVTEFPLADAEQAVAHAAGDRRFTLTVIRP